MWIFGYGSLVWKADFPYTHKLIGYIKGYDRRFWQASIDHRGTPEKPGRVVTLVPSSSPEARVWGAVYKIEESKVEEVLRHLDHREVMGYEKVPIIFHPVHNHPMNEIPMQTTLSEAYVKPFEVTMYYGSDLNEHYIGEAPIETIARRIWECVGPSGSNRDYLFNLASAMRQIEKGMPQSYNITTTPILDSHLAQLETAVIQLNNTIMPNTINSDVNGSETEAGNKSR